MTSLKLIFRPSRVEGKAGSLFMRVTRHRMTRQIAMGCKLHPHEWNNGQIKIPRKASPRRDCLLRVKATLLANEERINDIIRRLELSGKQFTADDVAQAFKLPSAQGPHLGCFAAWVVRHLRDIGKSRLAETYSSSVNSFMRFRGDQGDIALEMLNADLLKDYEHYLLDECGLNPNTSSFYMRNLRAIYNRAVDKELIPDRHPFKHVYTGVGKTAKRSIPPTVIKRIKALDLSKKPFLAMARDAFLLSFFLRGISFVDLAQLKLSNISKGRLRYCRQKTGQQLDVKWEPVMQEIVNSHRSPASPFLLPLIAKPGDDLRRQYLNALHRVNGALKRIGRMARCPITLTTYCARHAWASTARAMNVPIAVISEAMGHESERTTRIYLNALDNRTVDDANRRVMNAV